MVESLPRDRDMSGDGRSVPRLWVRGHGCISNSDYEWTTTDTVRSLAVDFMSLSQGRVELFIFKGEEKTVYL